MCIVQSYHSFNNHKSNISKMKLCYFFGAELKIRKLSSNFQLVGCFEQLQMLLLLKCRAEKKFCPTPFMLRKMEAQENMNMRLGCKFCKVQNTSLNFSSKTRTCSLISFDIMRVQNRIP